MQITHIRESIAPVVVAAALVAPSFGQRWTMGQSLSSPRDEVAGVAVGNFAMFAGGALASGGVSSAVDLYDRYTGAYIATTPLSLPRAAIGAASVGGYALFAGGRTSASTPLDRVDIYETITNTWSTAQLSDPRWATAAIAHDGRAYFAGGYWTNRVDIFEASSATWSTALLSEVRGEITAAAAGDYVLFAGGWTGLAPSATVDILHVPSQNWTTATLSVPRYRMGVVVDAGVIHFISGNQGASFPLISNRIDRFDTTTGTWTTATAAPATTRSLAASATLADYSVVLGGFAPAGYSGRADVRDLETGIPSVDTRFARARPAVAVFPEVAFFAGGLVPVGAMTSATDVVEIFRPEPGITACRESALNSIGELARIDGSGSASNMVNNLQLTATGLPNFSSGYFLVSQDPGLFVMPGGSQGTLCLGGAIGRYVQQVANSGTTGAISVNVNVSQIPVPAGPPPTLGPGDRLFFQAWYRDAGPSGPTSNFTTSYEVVVR